MQFDFLNIFRFSQIPFYEFLLLWLIFIYLRQLLNFRLRKCRKRFLLSVVCAGGVMIYQQNMKRSWINHFPIFYVCVCEDGFGWFICVNLRISSEFYLKSTQGTFIYWCGKKNCSCYYTDPHSHTPTSSSVSQSPTTKSG